MPRRRLGRLLRAAFACACHECVLVSYFNANGYHTRSRTVQLTTIDHNPCFSTTDHNHKKVHKLTLTCLRRRADHRTWCVIDLRGRQQAVLARVARTGEDRGTRCAQVVTELERRLSACSTCRRRASSCRSALVGAPIEPTSDVESAGQRVKKARHPCREARQSSREEAPRSRTLKLAA